MTEAKLVERVITHAKGIWCINDEGKRYHAQLGDTVKLSVNAAKRFARYCEAPGLAAAKAAVVEEEAKAAPPAPVVAPMTTKPPLPMPNAKPDLIKESDAE